MKIDIFSLLRLKAYLGTKPVDTSSKPQEMTLEVNRKLPSEPVLVGRLTCEEGEYVFRYDPEYVGEPIFAFPDVGKEYRSKYLWPFFSIRIPPLNREDMRKEMINRSLRDDQILEILGSVAKISVTSPYEFQLGHS